MTERSPLHRLTRGARGWYKHVPGQGTKYVASLAAAPTGTDADRIFTERFAELATEPVARGSVRAAADRYLEAKRAAISPGQHADYTRTLQAFCDLVGHDTPIDRVDARHFNAIAKAHLPTLGLYRRNNFVSWIRTFFNWCRESEIIRDAPRYGPEFKQPSMRDTRLHRRGQGPKLYAAKDLRSLLGAANPMTRTMILLGINGGFGNTELATLRRDEMGVDGVVRQIRQKTGADRIVPLWRETRAAIDSLPRFDSGLMFETSRGFPVKHGSTDTVDDWFKSACETAGVEDLGFYTLRRTFRTVADGTGDQRAVAAVIGHTVDDVASIYVQEISVSRLRAVVDAVRRWIGARPLPGPGASHSKPKSHARPKRTAAAPPDGSATSSPAGRRAPRRAERG